MKFGWIVFVAGAALAWGAYVPAIHHGQQAFSGPNKALRAFLFVGLAYFLMAVVVPGILLKTNPDSASFTWRGGTVSTVAGILGAAGALCVILALRAGGKPLYVAPLVFAGAPIVNVLVAWIWDRPSNPPHPFFFVGLLLAAAGAALVLLYKPTDAPKHPAPTVTAQVHPTTAPAQMAAKH